MFSRDTRVAVSIGLTAIDPRQHFSMNASTGAGSLSARHSKKSSSAWNASFACSQDQGENFVGRVIQQDFGALDHPLLLPLSAPVGCRFVAPTLQV
jgi:hypothetical protein